MEDFIPEDRITRLLFDTAIGPGRFEIRRGAEILASYVRSKKSRASEDAAYCIGRVCGDAEISNIKVLDEIICTKGPGGYTGMRIGLSTALGLSMSAGAKIYAYSSFEVLLGNFSDAAAAIEAGRQEVLLCLRVGSENREPQILSITEAIEAVKAAGINELVTCSPLGSNFTSKFSNSGLVLINASDNVTELLHEFHMDEANHESGLDLRPIYGREFGSVNKN